MIEKIYLHIGPHKTGSTTIQQSLGKNSELLIKHGYLYPYFLFNGQIEFNHSIPLESKFSQEVIKNGLAVNANFKQIEEQQKWKEAFDEQFKQQLNQFDGKYLILSGEDLSYFSTAQYLQLKRYLIDSTNEKVNFKILMVIRNPVDLFQSNVIEMIKNSFTLYNALQVLQINLSKRFCFFKDLIGTLDQVFERSNIEVYRFEDAIRHTGGPSAAFIQKLGVNDQLLNHFSNELYNPALSYEAATILSAINEKIPAKGGVPYIFTLSIKKLLINLKGQKFVFTPELQRKIWNLFNEDVNGICDMFTLPGYIYREMEVSPISERWSAETLKHLHTIFLSASEELRLIISEVLIKELSAHHKDFSKIQKNSILKFIAGSTKYITLPGKINTYDFLLKNMKSWKGISAITYCFINNITWLILKKRRTFPLNLRTLAEEKTLKHDIASVLYKNSQLHFTSTGRDPWFVIENPVPERRIKYLSIVLSVPENTTCQVFYTNKKNEDFTEGKSVYYFAAQGKNKAYFEFPTTEKILKIRIDPGQVTCEYIIYVIKVLTVNN